MRLVYAALALALLCSGCATQPSSPDQVRERTANATAEVKQDSKAIAEGIREGIKRDSVVNINTATQEELTNLPGVDDERAKRIIANRPYSATDELVTKHVMSKPAYDKISGRIKAK